ncbi:MAG: alpha/beta hydrolase [Proteobacteria bacterium]|nr:alpha/beta hydrolase [Pseudomonadota bacterium]
MTEIPFGYAKLDHPDILAVLFHPRKDVSTQPPPNAVAHDISVADGITVEGRLHLSDPAAPHILFFHGNGEIVSDYDDIGPMYNAVGLNFLAVDYRGYGNSTGTPTASSMMADAHTIFSWIKEWMSRENRTGSLIVMGRSLGSACAIELAASYPEDIVGLIIESGFAHTLPLLLTLGVDANTLDFSEMNGFKNAQKISGIAKPTLILHGQFDEIIPVASAEILQSLSPAKGKEFQMVPGADHNTIIEKTGRMYFEVIKRFTDKIACIKPKRYVSRRK